MEEIVTKPYGDIYFEKNLPKNCGGCPFQYDGISCDALEYDYCPDHNLERKYGVRKCLLENIRTTILKKYGGEDE